ncbi:hypothetical protein PTT_15759 [Pyrenophora teres f. teres 0-1]|uniref:Uncharacterized protein n=1 Tax=Pyrenophora teres f. teres (strain 0-1) TaxID=861557 RepID=E3S0W7_PYRTT|nr:hypothetical protein PTT_15759 [Pyrenophora teres f. teres 0-1]
MPTVLHIAHLHFHGLPKKNRLTIDTLLALAVVCEIMADVRRTILASVLDIIYETLDRIMKGPVCEVTESRETKCGAMVLGSYISFLLAKDLYSVRRAATETSLSIQEACDASKEVDIAISGATSKHSNSVYVHRGCFKGYDFEDLSNENPDSVGITYATHERTSKESRIDPR